MDEKQIIYGIQLDFDAECDPPKVFIADQGGAGTCYVEVLEEPIYTGEGEWSWELDDWEPGEMAAKILKFLNGEN